MIACNLSRSGECRIDLEGYLHARHSRNLTLEQRESRYTSLLDRQSFHAWWRCHGLMMVREANRGSTVDRPRFYDLIKGHIDIDKIQI